VPDKTSLGEVTISVMSAAALGDSDTLVGETDPVQPEGKPAATAKIPEPHAG
jgi:hypothetical protein